MPKLSSDDSYDIADNLALASAAILDYRVRTRRLTQAEREALEHAEDELDHRVVMFRNYGITISGAEAAVAQQRLQGAIDKAKATIAKIRSAKKAIAIAAALITLAGSIGARNADGILAAIKDLQDLVEPSGAGTQAPAEEEAGEEEA